jgi:hemolysin III
MLRKLREPVNGLTHFVGVLLSIVGLVALIIAANRYGTIWHVVSFSIFGSSMILLFSASTLYHWLPLSDKGVLLFKKIDHITIFILIAGTYTPFCLVPLRGTWGWSLLGTVWTIALAGLVVKIFWIHAPRGLSTLIYVGMSWIAVVAIYPMFLTIPIEGVFWILAGGFVYSIGAMVYAFKWPNPRHFGFHEIWHLFVLGGCFCHYWAIYAYVTYIH